VIDALARMRDDTSTCVAASVWAMPDSALLDALVRVHALEQRLAGLRLALIREVDGRDVAARQGAGSAAGWLWQRLHVTLAVARGWLQLARQLDEPPLVPVGVALASGELSMDQARVIASAVGELPKDLDPRIADLAVDSLIKASGQFDAWALRKLGSRILAHVAPEVAEEADRAKLEDDERRGTRPAGSHPVSGPARRRPGTRPARPGGRRGGHRGAGPARRARPAGPGRPPGRAHPRAAPRGRPGRGVPTHSARR
jgi:hypothetical protein